MRPNPAPSPAQPRSAHGSQGRAGEDWAGPGRLPTEAEAAAITAAVFDSPLVPRMPPEELRVTGIRTSTGAPDWAFAVLSPAGSTDPAIAVLRWDTGCGWVLDQVGTVRFGGVPGHRQSSPVRRGCEAGIREAGIRPGDAARPG